MMAMTFYVTPQCVVCHQHGHMLLDETKLNRWKAGEFVQDVWPDMSADDREMLISGTHPACWTELFGGEDDDE